MRSYGFEKCWCNLCIEFETQTTDAMCNCSLKQHRMPGRTITVEVTIGNRVPVCALIYVAKGVKLGIPEGFTGFSVHDGGEINWYSKLDHYLTHISA